MNPRFEESNRLSARLQALIPGGAHTYAKGDDQFPEGMAPVVSRGLGSHIWDVDGNEFIEYGAGLRAVTLGHAFPTVLAAVRRQLELGENYVRPAQLELECAERLLESINGAEMVKFGKDGSDATTGAVRLSRAYTGRDLVAICADHPFFSVDDWFIGTTPMNSGIPKTIQGLTLQFRYNDIANLEALFASHPGKIACVIMEAEKGDEPKPGYLQQVHDLCRKNGAVFVLDEMITGFRWHNGGAQAFHQIQPDLSCFGKAIGNGFSVSALAGRREIMRLGGLDHDSDRVFLLSATHGAENHALAAAMEVMRVYRDEPVVETLWKRGMRLATGINRSIAENGLEGYFGCTGKPCCLMYYTRDADKKPSQEFRTLFLQEIIKRGVIAPNLIVGYSHTDLDVDRTITAIHEALIIYRRALTEGIRPLLVGKPVKPVWRRHN
jgi:glutamate-1-semialdehyde 2,1-aminomutase